MATPPKIDLIPDPPLPTDPEDVFDQKAGETLTAQQAMVPQINAVVDYLNDITVDATEAVAAAAVAVAAKNDAQASAVNAAASAAAAEGAGGVSGNLATVYAAVLAFS